MIIIINMRNIELGQYFTTNIELKNKIFEFILNEPLNILEPCIGRGDLVIYISDKIKDITFDMYEIDKTIELLDNINKDDIIFANFLNEMITKRYRTIIGNPPYIRTKKGNLYIDFINKCYNLLENDGELIFIVPSDFFKLTSSSRLLVEMMMNGTFTHIYHPHNEKLFEKANIDVIIFRYCKNNSLEKRLNYNDEIKYINNNNGLITFTLEPQINNSNMIKDYFDVYVGLVSGKEEIYKNDKLGNIEVINGENKIDKYIYIQNYPCESDDINNYLLENKTKLLTRTIIKFNETNWFKWGAPRNINVMINNKNEDCIYIYNLTRKEKIAFIGKINYFGGNLLMLKPKKEYDLNKIVSYLNSDLFKNQFMFSGRFKIGHRQLSNSIIQNSYLLF